jgi:hypothetical protein
MSSNNFHYGLLLKGWLAQGAVLGILFMALFSCAKPGSTGDAPGDQGSGTAGGGGVASVPRTPVPQAALDGTLAKKGVITIDVTAPIVKSSFKGYLMGYESRYLLRQDITVTDPKKIRFKMVDIAPGQYELLVSGQAEGKDAAEPRCVGLRRKAVTVAAGESKHIVLDQLEACGQFTGNVKLMDGNDTFAGTVVHLAGTHLQAVSDAKGDFVIKGVPPGTYRIEFLKDGYATGVMEEQNAVAQETSPLAAMVLAKPPFSGSGIVFYPAIERKVTLILVAPPNAKVMKVGDSASLEDQKWQPLVTSVNYTFDSPGEKNLFVQFAGRNNENVSAVFVGTTQIE